ncbi:hypothetical protein FGO68_gene2303 [Halteria grandinella]|uniref:TRP C-terminal domain-containing protein n=1 Tax=Halteria grandinella TaxID=5974 RepID=A0A8J8P586_HALGN|nr:hypothetical protein FGO68_gene2303 [Halteria grandinella]
MLTIAFIITFCSLIHASYPPQFAESGTNTQKRAWPIVFGGYEGDTFLTTVEVHGTGILIGGETYDKSLHGITTQNGVPFIASYQSFSQNILVWARVIEAPSFQIYALAVNNYQSTFDGAVFYGDPLDPMNYRTLIFKMSDGEKVSAFSRAVPSAHVPINTDQIYQLRLVSAFGRNGMVISESVTTAGSTYQYLYNLYNSNSAIKSNRANSFLHAISVDQSGEFTDIALFDPQANGLTFTRYWGLATGLAPFQIFKTRTTALSCPSALIDSTQYLASDYLVGLKNCNIASKSYIYIYTAKCPTVVPGGAPTVCTTVVLESIYPQMADGSIFTNFEATSLVALSGQDKIYMIIRNTLLQTERFILRYSIDSAQPSRLRYYPLVNSAGEVREFRPMVYSEQSLIMVSSNYFFSDNDFTNPLGRMISNYKQAILYSPVSTLHVAKSSTCYDNSAYVTTPWTIGQYQTAVSTDNLSTLGSASWAVSVAAPGYVPLNSELFTSIKLSNIINVCSWCYPYTPLTLLTTSEQYLQFKTNESTQILSYQGVDTSKMSCAQQVIYSAILSNGEAIPSFLNFSTDSSVIIVGNTSYSGQLKIKVTAHMDDRYVTPAQIMIVLTSSVMQKVEQKSQSFVQRETFVIGSDTTSIQLLPIFQGKDMIIPSLVQSFLIYDKRKSTLVIRANKAQYAGNYTLALFEKKENGISKTVGTLELTIKRVMDGTNNGKFGNSSLPFTLKNLTTITGKIRKISPQSQVTIKFQSEISEGLVKAITRSALQVRVATRGSEILDFQINERSSLTLILQVDFSPYPYLSLETNADELEVTVVKNMEHKGQVLLSGTILNGYIPPQIDKNQLSTVLALQSSAQVVGLVVVSSSFLLNLLMSSSMSFIWGALSVLQSITILQLMSLQIPGQARLILDIAIQLASMDILPSQQIFDATLTFDQDADASVNEYFEQGGFESLRSVNNLQSTYLYLVVNTWLLLFVGITIKFKHKLSGRLLKLYLKIEGALCWNYFIRFILQSYQQLALATLINSLDFSIEYSGDMLSTLCAVYSLAIVVLSPFVAFMMLKSGTLPQSCDSLSEGLKLPSWTILYMLRRLFTVAIIFTLRDHSFFQLQLLILSSIVYQIAMITYNPYESRMGNMVEIFNELTISGCLYSYMLLTDFIQIPEARVSAGWGLTIIILLNIGVNMCISLLQSVSELLLRRKLLTRKLQSLFKSKTSLVVKLKPVQLLEYTDQQDLTQNHKPTFSEMQFSSAQTLIPQNSLLYEEDHKNVSKRIPIKQLLQQKFINA